MRIGYNPSSMEAYNALLKNDRSLLASSARLSSGIKISSASQNAAGLAISNNLRTRSEGLDKANQNASNAISLLQTADSALNEIHSILQRMRELAIQANNETNSDTDKANLQLEIEQLAVEIDNMSDRCEYNGMKLLSGGHRNQNGDNDLNLTFHVGTNKGYNMKVSIPEVSSLTLGMYGDGSGPYPVDVVTDASSVIVKADDAIDKIAKMRASIGAYSNRLEHTVAYLDASYNASSTSLSRIYDTDMAAEMTNYSRLQVLTQTATSIMAQANQTPQSVLQLLQ